MPIKPENRKRYPKNWKDVVAQIRERSGNRCEGSPDFPDCRRPNGWFLNKRLGICSNDAEQVEVWELIDGDPVIRIVLTVGHLNHQPEDCRPENLRHWCQRCHLNYDAAQHAMTARATRRSRQAIADLF